MASSRTSARFPADVLATIARAQVIGIHAGAAAHRVIAVWAVVAEGRVFVRPWAVSPDGWYFVFQSERTGSIHVGKAVFHVRAVFPRSPRLLSVVSRAYLMKYSTPGARKYVRDLSSPRSRAATVELVPAPTPPALPRSAMGSRSLGGSKRSTSTPRAS